MAPNVPAEVDAKETHRMFFDPNAERQLDPEEAIRPRRGLLTFTTAEAGERLGYSKTLKEYTTVQLFNKVSKNGYTTPQESSVHGGLIPPNTPLNLSLSTKLSDLWRGPAEIEYQKCLPSFTRIEFMKLGVEAQKSILSFALAVPQVCKPYQYRKQVGPPQYRTLGDPKPNVNVMYALCKASCRADVEKFNIVLGHARTVLYSQNDFRFDTAKHFVEFINRIGATNLACLTLRDNIFIRPGFFSRHWTWDETDWLPRGVLDIIEALKKDEIRRLEPLEGRGTGRVGVGRSNKVTAVAQQKAGPRFQKVVEPPPVSHFGQRQVTEPVINTGTRERVLRSTSDIRDVQQKSLENRNNMGREGDVGITNTCDTGNVQTSRSSAESAGRHSEQRPDRTVEVTKPELKRAALERIFSKPASSQLDSRATKAAPRRQASETTLEDVRSEYNKFSDETMLHALGSKAGGNELEATNPPQEDNGRRRFFSKAQELAPKIERIAKAMVNPRGPSLRAQKLKDSQDIEREQIPRPKLKDVLRDEPYAYRHPRPLRREPELHATQQIIQGSPQVKESQYTLGRQADISQIAWSRDRDVEASWDSMYRLDSSNVKTLAAQHYCDTEREATFTSRYHLNESQDMTPRQNLALPNYGLQRETIPVSRYDMGRSQDRDSQPEDFVWQTIPRSQDTVREKKVVFKLETTNTESEKFDQDTKDTKNSGRAWWKKDTGFPADENFELEMPHYVPNARKSAPVSDLSMKSGYAIEDSAEHRQLEAPDRPCLDVISQQKFDNVFRSGSRRSDLQRRLLLNENVVGDRTWDFLDADSLVGLRQSGIATDSDVDSDLADIGSSNRSTSSDVADYICSTTASESRLQARLEQGRSRSQLTTQRGTSAASQFQNRSSSLEAGDMPMASQFSLLSDEPLSPIDTSSGAAARPRQVAERHTAIDIPLQPLEDYLRPENYSPSNYSQELSDGLHTLDIDQNCSRNLKLASPERTARSGYEIRDIPISQNGRRELPTTHGESFSTVMSQRTATGSLTSTRTSYQIEIENAYGNVGYKNNVEEATPSEGNDVQEEANSEYESQRPSGDYYANSHMHDESTPNHQVDEFETYDDYNDEDEEHFDSNSLDLSGSTSVERIIEILGGPTVDGR